jgi:hypothetical protein
METIMEAMAADIPAMEVDMVPDMGITAMDIAVDMGIMGADMGMDMALEDIVMGTATMAMEVDTEAEEATLYTTRIMAKNDKICKYSKCSKMSNIFIIWNNFFF